jgi:serine/threonine protein kinase
MARRGLLSLFRICGAGDGSIGDADEEDKAPRILRSLSRYSQTVYDSRPNSYPYSEETELDSQALTIHDFQLLRVLGKGSFGKVMLVRKNTSGDYFAMKTLRKSTLIRRKQLAHTATERYVLENIKSPFLVSLKYAFQSSEKLYMVMDYM